MSRPAQCFQLWNRIIDQSVSGESSRENKIRILYTYMRCKSKCRDVCTMNGQNAKEIRKVSTLYILYLRTFTANTDATRCPPITRLRSNNYYHQRRVNS
ncbi:hypothetical protein PUN28_000948 [Cardiocondyla obscurior]|uniref:Uncharacterized protein n=1 Tax=Cardiocondyla obscurior TaxID=286306 RepID=A0AAW2H210_9HYME